MTGEFISAGSVPLFPIIGKRLLEPLEYARGLVSAPGKIEKQRNRHIPVFLRLCRRLAKKTQKNPKTFTNYAGNRDYGFPMIKKKKKAK